MYYEFYIDIFFIINLILNYTVLLLVKIVLKKNVSRFRVLMGSILGAILACVIIILPVNSVFIKRYPLEIITTACMVKTALNTRNLMELLKGTIILYFAAALMAGIMLNTFGECIGLIGAAATAVIVYFVVKTVYIKLRVNKLENNNLYKVKIVLDNNIFDVMGLYDTGNTLMDPYIKKPVNVMEGQIINKIINEGRKKIRYIPYHSIGKKQGLMPVVTAEKMYIFSENEEICLNEAVIGIAEEILSENKDYQIILNSKVFY